MADQSIYGKLGVPAAINAIGAGTLIGGSRPPSFVREAMEEVSTR